mgnify:CR=1 FL=1
MKWFQMVLSPLLQERVKKGYREDNDLAVNAKLNSPSKLAVDSDDNLYFIDSGNQRIHKISFK